MKFRPLSVTVLLCSLSACAFFDNPLDDLGELSAPAPSDDQRLTPPAPPPLPPPLPTPSQTKQTTAAVTSTDATYLIVSSIFEVPENVPGLSFVHFTDRSKRRETTLCEALLDTYPITRPADVPGNAENLIIWPVVEGTSADNCSAMVRAHEPLEISSETAAVVKAKGPYVMSRNNPQEKRMIYDFSSVSTGGLAGALTEWRQVLSSGAQSWPPVVTAK